MVSDRVESRTGGQGRNLLRADQGGQPHWSPQMQDCSQDVSGNLSASPKRVVWCREPGPAGGVVQAVSLPMVGRPPDHGTSGQEGGGDLCQRQDVQFGQVLDYASGGGEHWRVIEEAVESATGSHQFKGTLPSRDEASDVPMWEEGCPTTGEERGTNSRSSFLEVQSTSVHLLRMGSGGGGMVAAESTSGEGRRGSFESRGDGESRARGDAADGDESCRNMPSGDSARGESSVPPTDRVPEESVVLDECPGWREPHESSLPGSGIAAGGHAECHCTEEGARSGESGRSRCSRHVRFQDEGEASLADGNTMSPEEMEVWLQDNAPRVCMLENRSSWESWAIKQIESYEKPESHQEASMKVWYQQPDGVWQFHPGILPSFGSTTSSKAMGIYGGEVFWMDELYGQGEERALSRATRKSLRKQMKKLVVSEVFSPPRVSAVAVEEGHQSGGAFDLNTGYDLSTRRDRLRCWQELEKADPDLVVICPP